MSGDHEPQIAWPMIERCLIAQWRGLDERSQKVIDSQWKASHPYVAPDVNLVRDAVQTLTPIWSVIYDERPTLHLISVKCDSPIADSALANQIIAEGNAWPRRRTYHPGAAD